MFHANDVSVIITDSHRLIIWVNEYFTKMTGYSLTEVKGKKPSLLQGRNSEKVAIDRIRKKLKDAKPFHDRVTNYRKNGEEYTCALTVHPIFNTKGDLSNFVAFEVDNNFVDPNDVPLMKINEPSRKSYLTKSQELSLYFKLLEFFRKEKPYLDPNLTQLQVAKSIESNVKYISEITNNQTGKNFKFFVNKFRVQEFQKIISDGTMKNFTLQHISEHCGFKNKSTFHSVIFNHTGKTPKKIVDELLSTSPKVS